MITQIKEKKTKQKDGYNPQGEEKLVLDHLTKRIPVLKATKKRVLDGFNFEEMMKEADNEYQPHFLREKQKNKQNGVYLLQDELTGLRGSRVVKIESEGQSWRSDISEPTLLVKIQTALSILIDQNPEAVFKAVLEKYKPTTAIAQAIWKRSWEVAHSKEQLKLFVFDLAKYGWAIGRTYPRLVQRQGSILETLNVDDPSKNTYKEVTITEFNDIYREKLDPYRTWIDDMTNLTDPWSMDDWYFEIDLSKDVFDRDFDQYSNHGYIIPGQKEEDENDEEVDANEETKQRDDIVTLGFYESKGKDLYSIYNPKDNVVLYHSPLPNDEKMLSCWWTYWNERDPRTPYGIGLYEILKGDKVMYDRLNNMTMDQLVLSVYQMFFYSGTNSFISDGVINVSPGKGYQKLPGTTVETFKFDFDPKAFEGIDRQRERMDENTGITPTLQGQTQEGKTLGEVLHAKDAALKRLNIPLSNIANAITTDAYLTLSWANQVYSLPETKEFVDAEDLQRFQEEEGIAPESAIMNPDGSITADFQKNLDLSLDQDREGNLIEAPEARIFSIGTDIPRKNLNWKGRITVNIWSIIAPSQELERQRKLELFNLVMPVVQGIATSLAQGMYKVAVAMAKPVIQILEIQNEKPENWLPDEIADMIENPKLAAQMEKQAMLQQQTSQPLFTDANAAPSEQGPSAEKIAPMAENPVAKSLKSSASPMMK